MDKLTWYDEDGRLYCRRGYEVALAGLASYEATELMPDEIVKMGMMFEDSKRYSGHLELKLEAATRQLPRWVSVTERLPSENGSYIVHCDDSCEPSDERIWGDSVVLEADWCFGAWSWNENGTEYDLDGIVTHWMPLPEPPKEADRND